MRKKTKIKYLIGFSLIFSLTIPIFNGIKWSANTSIFYTNNYLRSTSPEGYNFTRAVQSNPSTIDPVDCYTRQSQEIIRQVAETLWFYNWTDPDLPRINMLAESEIWKNSTALEVTLRQGVTFHDGTPFNASVVKWNIERMMDLFNHTGALASGEHIGNAHIIFELPNGSAILAGFEVTGDYTGIIHLAQPFTSLMDILSVGSASMISPTAHASDAFIDLSTGDLIGTGPYMYDHYIADTEVRFSRWDNYWRDPVVFDEMIFEIIQDSVTRNNAMLNGEVDYLSGIRSDFVDTFKAHPNITFHESTTPSLTLRYLVFNNQQINITWRKAMSYAFDYYYVIQDYSQGFRAYGPVSAGFGEWYNSTIESFAPYYNLTIARQTLIDDPGIDTTGLTANDDLNDAAWLTEDLATFNYTYYEGSTWQSDLYPLLNDWFDKIGITILDGGTDWDSYVSITFGKFPGEYNDLQICWTGWTPDYFDPINMFQPLLSNVSTDNKGQVNDSKLEQMFVDYLNETDYAKKVEMIYNMSKYLLSELYPHIYGYHDLVQICHSKALCNVPYEIDRYTFYAYPIKLSEYVYVSNPEDIVLLVGETGYNITWSLFGENLITPMYYVYKDSNLVANNTFQSGDSVDANLDGLSLGTYNYSIHVQNGKYSVKDNVIANIVPRLVISHPTDISYTQGATGNVISWVVGEGYEENATYYIYDDSDTLVQSDSWEINVSINLDVDGLSAGSYSYRIEVHNTLEYVEDTVGVEVKKKGIPGFSILILLGLALISVTYIGIKSKHKLT